MILNKECYWNILDYTFQNLHFKEGAISPSDVITIETDDETKNIWLKDVFEKLESDNCPREAILSAIHILVARDIIKILYVAHCKFFPKHHIHAKHIEFFVHVFNQPLGKPLVAESVSIKALAGSLSSKA